ncbi:MAG: metallophosphoesterase family protein [Chloroflexota bacterium]
MRVAILSDIHGNLVALEAVLSELACEPIDQVVCLGDVAVLGPQPRQVVGRLRDLNCPVVMGNTDAWVLNPWPHETRDEDSVRVKEVEEWCAAQLTAADLDTLRTFQPTIEIALGGDATLLGYHGSPHSYHDVMRVTTPDEEIGRMVGGRRATVMAGGHTHRPMLRRFETATLINPGSVGLPFEVQPGGGRPRNPTWAEYAVVTWQDGRLSVDFRRVPYDLAELQAAVRATNMPHAEWWLQDWT